jgi:Tfp pilus assembly protein PilE
MVEMLGVLAIIGVLSVSGISAYGVAMKKHKANELIAATMQEAVLISAQLATGKTNPSLSSFNNSLFTSASTVANSDNFKITLNAVDEDVCKQMKSMLGVSSMVHEISDNCGEMTFHKNLTPKAVTQSGGNSGGTGSEGGNSGVGGSTEPVDPCADVNCGEHGTCVDGACDCEDGYGGDECKELFTCNQSYGIHSISLDKLDYTESCARLDGCKVINEAVPADKWLDLCNTPVPDGYYTCVLMQVFDSDGNFIKNCEAESIGCGSPIHSTLDTACEFPPSAPPLP